MATVEIATQQCMHCHKASSIVVDVDQYAAWTVGGMLTQEAFPDLSDDQRELLISGTHPACWEQMFGGMDED